MPKRRLHAFVSRGARSGELLFPHKHEDQTYVVSKTRFEDDYIRVAREVKFCRGSKRALGCGCQTRARASMPPA